MSLMRWLGVGEEASLKRTLDEADKSLADTNSKITTLENRIRNLGGSVIAPAASTTTEDSTTATNPPATTETDKERKAHLKRQRDERRELEAEAKQAYEQEKLELRRQYQGKEKLQDEWHEREYQAEQRYINRLAQIRTTHNASEADRMEVANMQLDSITREANRQREVEQRKTAERPWHASGSTARWPPSRSTTSASCSWRSTTSADASSSSVRAVPSTSRP